MTQTIPVLRPKLPDRHAILPYLEQIDAHRWYGNFGPLVLAFEERVARAFGTSKDAITMVANGTLGLTVALQALEVKRGGYCLMPSWTFTATPAAALAAGLTPAFMDVELPSQQITPESARHAIKKLRRKVSAVIPVSPFGAPVDVAEWDRFTEETGIPVVIDAAAAFDSFHRGTIKVGRTPVMISLHTTKICGTGEGGLVLTTSKDTSYRVRKIINFGFEEDRLSHRVAINAKPSEYNAAVAMAVLDGWDDIRAAWARIQHYYTDRLGMAGFTCWMHPDWVTSTCNVLLPKQAVEAAQALKLLGIDTRRWWETGCHANPAYRDFPVIGDLPNTQYLGQTMLGIPSAMDLTDQQLDHVTQSVIKVSHGLGQLALGDATRSGLSDDMLRNLIHTISKAS